MGLVESAIWAMMVDRIVGGEGGLIAHNEANVKVDTFLRVPGALNSLPAITACFSHVHFIHM